MDARRARGRQARPVREAARPVAPPRSTPWPPPRATGCSWRRAGTAGTRACASRRRGSPTSGPSATSRPASASTPTSSGNYRLEPERGGGALYDVGHYAVSACLWAVGRGLPDDVVARSELGPTGVDLDSRAVLAWDGAEAEVRASIAADDGQWLVITGERGELELRGRDAFTAWKDDATELWVSDGTSTEHVPVPAADAYAVMVEEVSSAVRGGPGLGAAAGGLAGDGRGAGRRLRQRRAGAASRSSRACPTAH